MPKQPAPAPYEPPRFSEQWLRWNVLRSMEPRPDLWYMSDDEVALYKAWLARQSG
jgi:hypothetical protein